MNSLTSCNPISLTPPQLTVPELVVVALPVTFTNVEMPVSTPLTAKSRRRVHEPSYGIDAAYVKRILCISLRYCGARRLRLSRAGILRGTA